ncbi:MAG: hypothetical protein WB789_04545 [Thermoplasmata archaeon]
MSGAAPTNLDRLAGKIRWHASKVLQAAARDAVTLTKITYQETSRAVKEVVDQSRRDPRKPA